MTDASFDIQALTPDLVQRLVASQFPQWSHLSIQPAEPQGWDNRTFRLGKDLSARLPSDKGYVPQVAKEQRWLPVLAASLSWPIPVPVGLGRPGQGYPFPWSVYRWLDGRPAGTVSFPDLSAFAADVARFLRDLQSVEAGDGPGPGSHSFFRGGPLSTYDAETRACLTELGGVVDTNAARNVWEAALAARWNGRPVWFHGDVAVNNLLVKGGRLSGVIDFGCAGVGDPACDLVIAWTMFEGESRKVFKAGLSYDAGTWARARGWALWKALLQVRETLGVDGVTATAAHRVLLEVIADHQDTGAA